MIIEAFLSTLLWDIPVEDKAELDILVQNVWHEARGEGLEGMVLVASVTKNRVESSKYPNSYHSVIHQKHQFSWVKEKAKFQVKNEVDKKNLQEVVLISAMVYNGLIADPTGGAMHYYNPSKVSPLWAQRGEVVYKHNNHVVIGF